MFKCYCFDLFFHSYRTRYEYECDSLSEALAALSYEDPRVSVCDRYIVQYLNDDGVSVAVKYKRILSFSGLRVIRYSKNLYDSTIFVPFPSFVAYVDCEEVG